MFLSPEIDMLYFKNCKHKLARCAEKIHVLIVNVHPYSHPKHSGPISVYLLF